MIHFLTMFPKMEKVHLYKDVGMIPYSLAKYKNVHSSLFYESNQKIVNEEFEKFVDLIWVPKRRFSTFNYIRNHAKDFDVINVYHLSLKKMFAPALFKIFNRNCVVYLKLDLDKMNFDNFFSGSLRQRILRVLKKGFIHFFVDKLSVETKSYYDRLKDLSLFEGKLYYIPNGVHIIEDEKIISKEKIILSVGRIGTYQKNNEMLVNAVKKLPELVENNWKIYFVGPVQSNFRKYLKQTMEFHPELKDTFVLTGNIEDRHELYSFYKRAKILCMTSRWEGFSLVIPEAMYFENFVISTDFDSAYELLAHGRYGEIIQVDDVVGLQQKLKELIVHEEKYVGKAKDGSVWIRKNFLWENIVKDIYKMLGEKL